MVNTIRSGDENMKRNLPEDSRGYLVLTAIVMSFTLLLQVGCQEQAQVVRHRRKPVVQEELETPPEQAAPTQEKRPSAGPRVTFENVVYDFGEVGPGTKKTGEFRFVNTGNSVLKITEIERCCGVVAKLDKTQYSPGEGGALAIQYSAPPRAGLVRRQLYFNSNDKENPRIALTVRAKIVPKVDYEPRRLNLLLKDENAGCRDITLSSLDNKPFSIRHFRSTADCITADIDSSVEATKFVLRPQVDLQKLRRALNGVIYIGLTHPECSEVTITYNAMSRFKTTPPQIIVFKAEPDKPIVRKVWILSNYSEDFEIESTSSDNNLIKLLSQKKITNGYQLEVEVMPPPAGDNRRFTDMFRVSIKGNGQVTLRCIGFYATK
jgi:hypothetical protein